VVYGGHFLYIYHSVSNDKLYIRVYWLKIEKPESIIFGVVKREIQQVYVFKENPKKQARPN